jgi:hypothetical protein
MSKRLALTLVIAGLAFGTEGVRAQTGASCKLAPDQQGLQGQVQSFKDKIAADQQALSSLRLENREADFDDWAKLTDEAKADLIKQRWDSALDTVFTGSRAAVQSWGSTRRLLDTYNAAYAIDKLKALNNTPVIGSAASGLETLLAKLSGTMVGKVEADAVLDNASKAVDSWKEAYRLNKPVNTVDDYGEAMATVGGWFLKSNEATALAKVLQFAISGSYDALTYYYSSQNVDNLTKLTENQLQRVSVLTTKLDGDVSCFQQAKSALAKPNAQATVSTYTPPKHGHTGLIVGGVVAAGGAGAAAYEVGKLIKKNSSSNSTSSSSSSGGGSATGQCDTLGSNACGSCTCTPAPAVGVSCNNSPQCGGGGCWVGTKAPFC